MTPSQLVEEINALPPDLREQALDFIAFLQTKAQKQPSLPKQQFDAGKSLFTPSNDFTEPSKNL